LCIYIRHLDLRLKWQLLQDLQPNDLLNRRILGSFPPLPSTMTVNLHRSVHTLLYSGYDIDMHSCMLKSADEVMNEFTPEPIVETRQLLQQLQQAEMDSKDITK
jgi:hypothetical protein